MKILFCLLLLLSCALCGTHVQAQVSKNAAAGQARRYAQDSAIVYDSRRNIYINQATKTIHLFMYEDGELLLTGYPTTATDKDKFQLHLYTSSDNPDTYTFSAEGNYTPSLVITGVSGIVATLNRQDFPIVGPFTSQVVFTTKRSGTPGTTFSQTIKIANTIHASIGSGFVYSTLKNPTNIHGVPITTAGGDSTLLADNATGKVNLTLMATLYPWGRNSLLLPSWSFRDRAGIVVGTTIASSTTNFQNLYLGLQYDFAIGGSVVAGVDIASRQRVRGVDYHDFTFGESKFSGKVSNKLYKELGAGFFIGVQVDTRIFAKLFTAAP
ncbi:hypothetical protein [Hymenobacter cheonanensis]|uniref:hypothetical protein n=1 Tax=Hymenobacter sp. CA2-7 TaxID=3063993 RepID=UPI0027125362|nr:hypothetical protein [Hymenobacter sp. CA2-7]MDO7884254.1 hypothetical protein [Hymenobacter sp. CA2-7]